MTKSYTSLFNNLTQNLELFIQEVNAKKLTQKATDQWTVKDVLCHITFWHENYAANYKALSEHIDPPLPQDMSTINIAGVLSLNKLSVKVLIAKLMKAHKSLYKSIVEKKVPHMTYSKGGRTYKTADFLELIIRHLATHTRHIKKAK